MVDFVPMPKAVAG